MNSSFLSISRVEERRGPVRADGSDIGRVRTSVFGSIRDGLSLRSIAIIENL